MKVNWCFRNIIDVYVGMLDFFYMILSLVVNNYCMYERVYVIRYCVSILEGVFLLFYVNEFRLMFVLIKRIV